MNNKAISTIKKAYSFKSHKTLETARYHQPGKIPQLVSTYRFC